MAVSDAWRAPDARDWSSGPWSLEARGDEFADIRYGGRLVLRSVRAVVRDSNWDTAALAVTAARSEPAALVFEVCTSELGADIAGTVRADADGDSLTVSWDAASHGRFSTNRTGLVVLHPPDLAGVELAIEHSDGSRSAIKFPRSISPHQPAFDIAGLRWRADGLDVGIEFEGDVFEMEDQRNWSDPSYKTYSRPLALPYPYELAAGERLHQRVRITVAGKGAPGPRIDREVIHLESAGAVPEIALGAATAPGPAPARAGSGPDVVLVELDLRTPNWRAALARAAGSAGRLDVRVISPAAAPLDDVVAAVGGVDVARIAVVDADSHVTDSAALARLRGALEHAGVRIPVVGGTRAHFTELNRERAVIPDDLDGIVFSTTPLFHSRGTAQLVESIAVQRTIAAQAVESAGGRPVHVGPITLRPRFNNVATAPEPLPARADLATGYGAEFTGESDPRQSSPELAAWTIASAAALAVPGVASLAYFEEWGARGIRSADGEPYPVAEAIEWLAELRTPGARLLWGDSPDGLVWAIGAQDASGTTILIANLDAARRAITVCVRGGELRVSLAGFRAERHALPG